MFPARIDRFPVPFLLFAATLLTAQEPDRAPALRALLAQTPALGLDQVVLSAALPNASELGTVSSVAVAPDGTIYAFQRGEDADPVIAVDQQGRVLRSWGKGMFTVPHSIRVDPQGNVWTVDAGNSVLQKFTPDGTKLMEISVGEVQTGDGCAFPTLCGTTDVAFAPDGRLFISDGYGNARVLEYSATGERLNVWGSAGTGPGQFQIPHGIAASETTLYVADRTNARIQRFDFEGHYLGEWTHLGRPYALQLRGGALWVSITTIEAGGRGAGPGLRATPWIIKVDPTSGEMLGQIEAPGTGPHSIDADAAGHVYSAGAVGPDPASYSVFR